MSEHQKHVRMTDAEFFKGWTGGLPETPCGFGSKVGQTRKQRAVIPGWIEKYKITSVADIGAGDLNWAKLVDFGCPYAAYDLIPRVPGVVSYNLITQPLPRADCYMVLWVLNHLSVSRCKVAIRKLLKSKARFLMVTYDPRMPESTDLEAIESVVLYSKANAEPKGEFELRLIRL